MSKILEKTLIFFEEKNGKIEQKKYEKFVG